MTATFINSFILFFVAIDTIGNVPFFLSLTEDVKQALQAKGIDISPVADKGPTEPVIVIPVSIIMQRYPGESPEDSMRQFVEDMTQGGQPPVTEQPVSAPEMAAEAPPSPEGLGAPMNRPPAVA